MAVPRTPGFGYERQSSRGRVRWLVQQGEGLTAVQHDGPTAITVNCCSASQLNQQLLE